jgi:hypothetical protein
VRGRANLRRFVAEVFAHQPATRRRIRAGYLTDGSRLRWEYPRESPVQHRECGVRGGHQRVDQGVAGRCRPTTQ